MENNFLEDGNFRFENNSHVPPPAPLLNCNDGVKITNVAYKLLDFFPDGEPLKNKAKEKVLVILENLTLISDTKGWISLKKEKASAELLDDIEVLKSYLKLAKYQKWIDNINFLIITKEYNRIKDKISPPKGTIKKNIEIASKIEEKVLENSTLQKSAESEPVIIDKVKTMENYSERQKKILKILQEREKAQVSDLIKELPNITKRTVRRELDDLLKKGRIVRVGEWNQVFYKTKAITDRTIILS